jgi:hypothetical protein
MNEHADHPDDLLYPDLFFGWRVEGFNLRLTTPWDQAIANAMAAADEFTATMRKIVDSAGVAPDDVEALRQRILDMATSSAMTATQAAAITLQAVTALDTTTWTVPYGYRAPRPPEPRPKPTIRLDTRVTVTRLAPNGYNWKCTRQTTRECC